MAKDSVFHFLCEVKPSALPFYTLNNPYALLIMCKAIGQQLSKGTLSVMPKGSMPKVMP